MIKYLNRTFTVLALLCSVILPTVGQTSAVKQKQKAEKLEAKIRSVGTGPKAFLKIKLSDDSTREGYISQANDLDFVVVDKGGNSSTVRYSDVHSVRGKGWPKSLKVGLGVVAVLWAISASINLR